MSRLNATSSEEYKVRETKTENFSSCLKDKNSKSWKIKNPDTTETLHNSLGTLMTG